MIDRIGCQFIQSEEMHKKFILFSSTSKLVMLLESAGISSLKLTIYFYVNTFEDEWQLYLNLLLGPLNPT